MGKTVFQIVPGEPGMSDREKAYSIMARTGQTRHIADSFTDEECRQLAQIHMVCGLSDEPLKERIDEFWSRRSERLAEQKATDDVQPTPTT